MTSKLLAGCAAVLFLSFGAGQVLAQQASAKAGVDASAGESANGAAAASAHGTGAPAPTARKARGHDADGRAPHRNVVTSTLAGVPGLVGSTVGGGLSQTGSTIVGTVGGALGVGKH
jgi:hypothetical protein